MSLITQFLPQYHSNEQHSLIINGELGKVYRCVRNFTFTNTILTSILFLLRGLSTQKVSLQTVLDSGFIFLGEKESEEFVIGLIGKFWTPTGCLQRMTAEEFIAFDKPGFAKAVWNFSFERISETSTRVSTETRIMCLDNSSRMKFRLYWTIVRPFSGLIRIEILRSIAKAMEK